LLSVSGIGLIVFVTLTMQVWMGNSLYPGEVFMAISIFYMIHFNAVLLSTIGINTTFAFIATMKRVGQVLALKEHETVITQYESSLAISLNNVTFSWRNRQMSKI